jgi:hypothetical protein
VGVVCKWWRSLRQHVRAIAIAELIEHALKLGPLPVGTGELLTKDPNRKKYADSRRFTCYHTVGVI